MDEKIDIWSLGNNFYSLLTGHYPFYQVTQDTKEIQEKIKGHETSLIDPRFKERSFAERTLAEIIPMCWEYEPDDRVDIFELLRLLRQAVKENQRHTKHILRFD